jgi:hypothetical protein
MGALINSLWMKPMNRCHSSLNLSQTVLRLCALALASLLISTPAVVRAQTDAYPVPMAMAMARMLPPASLRGELLITGAQSGELNGNTETLAPGLRVRGANNLLLAPGMLMGKEFVVNYVRDSYGLIYEVWILRDDERAKRWPKTSEEAAKWLYDPYTQTWTKP